MKLSIFDRLLLFLSMIAMLFAGIFLVLVSISVISVYDVFYGFKDFISTSYGIVAVIVISAVIICVAVKLILSLFISPSSNESKTRSTQTIMLKNDSSGNIMVSSDLIRDLATRYARTSDDVKDVECMVISAENGVKLMVKFFFKKDIVINEFLDKMQKDMKEYIEAHCGIDIVNIDLCADVNGAANNSKLR